MNKTEGLGINQTGDYSALISGTMPNLAAGKKLNIKVTAEKGSYAPYSIGSGTDSTCGTVTIGGTIYWQDNAELNGGNAYLGKSSFTYPPE